MAKLNLARAYTYAGKDYGPGNDVEVPDEIPTGNNPVTGQPFPPLRPADDIRKKEDAYQAHLQAGGEPVAPVTPGIAATGSQPEGLTSLAPPRPRPAAVDQQPDTADRRTFRTIGEPAPAAPGGGGQNKSGEPVFADKPLSAYDGIPDDKLVGIDGVGKPTAEKIIAARKARDATANANAKK